jgi:prepilin-type N-terminal cleavage/methylation domain-containing protein
MRHTRTAFSLPELLVVIGIIGVLVAIVLPVFGKVRHEANKASCLNNLRQISQMASAYATSNKNRLPVNSILVTTPINEVREDVHPPPFYVALLRSVTSDKGPHIPSVWYPTIHEKYSVSNVFHCPGEDSSRYSEATARQFVSLTPNPIHWYVSEWKVGASYGLNGGLVNKSDDTQFDHCYNGGNVSRMKNSAATVLAYDVTTDPAMFMVGTPELTVHKTAVTLWDVLAKNDKVSSSWRNEVKEPFDTRRHRGMVNMVCVDGHAVSVQIGKDLKSYFLLSGG